jgi:organic hydroperoxide reductase OsmC/OhrA
MRISAHVHNSRDQHQVTLRTDAAAHSLAVRPKASGFGSQTNGGELLFLALATCYCNDLYREAAKRGIVVAQVDVEVAGEFGAVGGPATGVTYRAKVAAQASAEAIRELMGHTDRVAEIQNTLRVATPVTLSEIEAVSL